MGNAGGDPMGKQKTDQYDRHPSGEAPPESTADQVQPQSRTKSSRKKAKYLYFFPDQSVEEGHVRQILAEGSLDDKAWVISHLLKYAPWDEIWSYVTRDEVRAIFPKLDLPAKLQNAWAKMLDAEVQV